MSVSAISAGQAAQADPASAGTAAKDKFSQEYTQFLKLLTAQVENQDPLEPLDSAAFVEQLATFSGLEQQVQTNDLLKDILTALRVDGTVG